jgi:hypothetical protein
MNAETEGRGCKEARQKSATKKQGSRFRTIFFSGFDFGRSED